MSALREEAAELPEVNEQQIDIEEHIEEVEAQEEEHTEVNKELSAEEQQARDNGWIDLEEWTSQGKDPAEWGGYKAFNKNGSILKQKYAQERSHQKQIEDLNKYHKLQLESQKKLYKEQQREAVENADTDAFEKAQTNIDAIDNQLSELAPKQTSEDQRIEDEWVNNNAWFTETDELGIATEKALYAQQAAQKLMQSYSGQDLIDKLESAVAKRFPTAQPTNPNRERASLTERSAPKASRKSEKVSFETLTAEERQMWNTFKSEMTKEQYLKVVENARK